MVELNPEAKGDYEGFKSGLEELLQIGEKFIQEKVFHGIKIEKYIQVKDRLVYYIYHYFPHLYDKYFADEPLLPKISIWYYVLNNVLWIPDKLLNRFWWPKYGSQVVEYMTYYNRKIYQINSEIEDLIK